MIQVNSEELQYLPNSSVIYSPWPYPNSSMSPVSLASAVRATSGDHRSATMAPGTRAAQNVYALNNCWRRGVLEDRTGSDYAIQSAMSRYPPPSTSIFEMESSSMRWPSTANNMMHSPEAMSPPQYGHGHRSLARAYAPSTSILRSPQNGNTGFVETEPEMVIPPLGYVPAGQQSTSTEVPSFLPAITPLPSSLPSADRILPNPNSTRSGIPGAISSVMQNPAQTVQAAANPYGSHIWDRENLTTSANSSPDRAQGSPTPATSPSYSQSAEVNRSGGESPRVSCFGYNISCPSPRSSHTHATARHADPETLPDMPSHPESLHPLVHDSSPPQSNRSEPPRRRSFETTVGSSHQRIPSHHLVSSDEVYHPLPHSHHPQVLLPMATHHRYMGESSNPTSIEQSSGNNERR